MTRKDRRSGKRRGLHPANRPKPRSDDFFVSPGVKDAISAGDLDPEDLRSMVREHHRHRNGQPDFATEHSAPDGSGSFVIATSPRKKAPEVMFDDEWSFRQAMRR